MSRRTARRVVDAQYWEGRLDSARSHLRVARDATTLAEPGHNAAGAVSLMVLAVIAYADSLTAYRARVINQQDHRTMSRLLRDVLGDTLPASQERFLVRMLGMKDEAHYGTRLIRLQEAQAALEGLEHFARWAEDQLRG